MFYEFCYIENNKYYINVEENNRTIKFFSEDYFEKIKEKGFMEDLWKYMHYQKYTINILLCLLKILIIIQKYIITKN